LTAAYAATRADREDLFQEIRIALWRALPRFRYEASIRTFVFRVARNRCVTFRLALARRMARETSVEDTDATRLQKEPTVLRTVDAQQRAERLRAAVARLPVDLRRTILLRLEGLTDREIGARLGITENNTAVRLFRARNSLRGILDPRDFAW
jgi:RNA polymerase sigma-70 factor (ECF subfamily)